MGCFVISLFHLAGVSVFVFAVKDFGKDILAILLNLVEPRFWISGLQLSFCHFISELDRILKNLTASISRVAHEGAAAQPSSIV